jgi:hypothetical protein
MCYEAARGKAAPLAEAAILLGISLGCAVAYSGSSTGKLFMPLGSATEMLATGAARWFLASILAPAAITLTAATVSNAAAMIKDDTWGMARSPQGLGVPLFPLFKNRADCTKAL